MKSGGSFWVGTIIISLATGLHAQTAVVGSFNNGFAPVQSATPDSIVQLTANAQGLTQIAPADLPRTGTYWLVLPSGIPAPAPCPPLDPGMPVYQMASGQFLVDETGGQVAVNTHRFGLRAQAMGSTTASALEAQANTVVSLISQVQTAAANQQMLAMGLDVPLVGGGGGGGTNDYAYSFTPLVYTTNDLWLSMNGVTNTTAYITIHPPWNVTNSVYDLLYTTNLSPPISWQWLQRSFAGQNNLVVDNATDAHGFYWLDAPTNDLAAHGSMGTNFWVAFYPMDDFDFAGDFIPPNLWLFISSPVGASGTVTIPGLGIANTFTLAAGTATNMSIPSTALIDYWNCDAVQNKGILIAASQPVSVYGFHYLWAGSAAFTGYPTTMLGTNYCLMARPSHTDGESEFAIVATADDTNVKITPSRTANLEDGRSDTDCYTTNLQQGQTYQIESAFDGFGGSDVTGTWITSDKPIGVFAGSSDAFVPDPSTAAGNTLVQEQLPVDSWGTLSLALSFAGRINGASYRVLAAYSNTVVTITGTVVTPIALGVYDPPWIVTESNEVVVTNLEVGQFCDIIVDGPVIFQASQPVQVAQFANGSLSDHAYDSDYEGDPCDILLLPAGHYFTTNMVFVPFYNTNSTGDFVENYLNIIVAQSAITNTFVDTNLVTASYFKAIGASGYYGAQLPVTAGTHKVTSSLPVGVEVYGFGVWDAYGYFGGVVK